MNQDLYSHNAQQTLPPVLPSYPAPSDPFQHTNTWRFVFRGNSNEYFKIWITNLFLTIITLSFYSPWAKVRHLRYFYGNTYLNRRKFDFTALPWRILIGRIVAIILFSMMSFFSQLSMEYYFLGLVIIALFIPWLIRSTLRFRSRNSKYANSRFYFSASMAKTYITFGLCALVIIFTLGLAYPIALLWYKRYQLNHLYLGHLKFQLHASAGDFFKAIIKSYFAFFCILCTAAILVFILISSNDHSNIITLLLMVLVVLYILGFTFLTPLIQGYIFKTTWNNVTIGNSHIYTDCNPWKFAWIKMTNYFAIILSFGLLLPWASIRLYRYKIESITVCFFDDPEHLINITQKDPESIGEEIADVFDIDISL